MEARGPAGTDATTGMPGARSSRTTKFVSLPEIRVVDLCEPADCHMRSGFSPWITRCRMDSGEQHSRTAPALIGITPPEQKRLASYTRAKLAPRRNPAMVAPIGKPQNMIVIIVPRRRSGAYSAVMRNRIWHYAAEIPGLPRTGGSARLEPECALDVANVTTPKNKVQMHDHRLAAESVRNRSEDQARQASNRPGPRQKFE